MSQVVITGRGIISPVGNSVSEFLAALRGNVQGIRRISWASGGDKVWFAPVTGFDPLPWMSEKVADGTDLFSQWAIAATVQALAEAGLSELDPERTAIVHGTSMGGTRTMTLAQRLLEQEGPAGVDRKTLIRMLPNMAASQIAMRWGLHGPLLTITTACASSLDAIGNAARMIATGAADVAITGGTEAVTLGDGDFAPAWYYAQEGYGMISKGEDARRTLMPFERDRGGIVIGDGSAMLILESAEHARRRGATPLGEVRGYASIADGSHPSAPEPSGKWEASVMRQALAAGDLEPGDVDAVYAHATGTRKGDSAEIRAINTVHGGRALPVTGLKGHTGHTGASSGAMSVVAALETFATGMLPNVSGTTEVDPEADFRVITASPATVRADVIQVNSFGFGGQNASLVISRAADTAAGDRS